MTANITTAFVQQYKANVQLLSQQMGSRLRGAVRVEAQDAEYAWYEQLPATAAATKTARHAETDAALADSSHQATRVGMADYAWAEYIDREDKVRMLIDPTSPYAQNAAAAFGRAMDDVLIAAANGTAFRAIDEAKSAGQAEAFPAGQIVAIGTSGLTIAKLVTAKGLFWAADVSDEIPKFIACTGTQLQDLLATTEVTSADYNTVRALVRGEIDTYMGFKFIRTERIDNTTTNRHCLAWAQDGLLLSLGIDINAKIGERADKQYLTQVFTQMTIGAVRMEDAKVVQIDCLES